MKHLQIDKTLAIYMLVNLCCWVIGTGLMFLLYNLHLCSYWLSSVCNYLVGGTLGYFLNKRYTFHNHGKHLVILLRYILHMVLCYLIAYGLAPQLCGHLTDSIGLHMTGNISLGVGAVLFMVLNYFGQRYVVFRKKDPPAASVKA